MPLNQTEIEHMAYELGWLPAGVSLDQNWLTAEEYLVRAARILGWPMPLNWMVLKSNAS